jgi:hypothetical protein
VVVEPELLPEVAAVRLRIKTQFQSRQEQVTQSLSEQPVDFLGLQLLLDQ